MTGNTRITSPTGRLKVLRIMLIINITIEPSWGHELKYFEKKTILNLNPEDNESHIL